MAKKKIPDLYKYLTAEGLKSLLLNQTFRWSHPRVFNDPYDNDFDLKLPDDDEINEQQVIDLWMSILDDPDFLVKNEDPEMLMYHQLYKDGKLNFTPDVIKKQAQPQIKETIERIKKVLFDGNIELRKILNNARVICFTEKNDNLLMWAHYSQNHRGGLIKVRPNHVKSELHNLEKVKYSPNVPAINIQNFKSAKVYEMLCLTKGMDWQYEQEWRIVSEADEPTQLIEHRSFHKSDLEAIYLGCRITDEDKAGVLKLVKHLYEDVEVYQVKRLSEKFALTFERIF